VDIVRPLWSVILNHRPWASNWKTLSLAAASRAHPFCNLQNRARTHVVLVIGLYELLGVNTHPRYETNRWMIAWEKCIIGKVRHFCLATD
jgi:hypothetical protein